MKTVLFTSLFISFGAFAQSIDLLKFKSLIEERKSSLEVIRPGMSSKTYTQMRELQCENKDSCRNCT